MNQDAPKIVVVGSSNMDLVVKSERIPAAGETILGGDFIVVPGGKGANQAVAAAKLGANVCFIAKLGEDVFAAQSLANFEKEGVHTSHIQQTQDAPSGVALIMVDEEGENSIVVAPGANLKLSPDDVRAAKTEIEAAGAVVAQLEVPLETIQSAAELANSSGVPFVLDPAPARELPPGLLAMVDVLTPNETEAQILTGIEVTNEDSAREASKDLIERGVKAVILTLSSKGFVLVDNGHDEYVSAHRVQAVDSTAAGDAFTGSLAVGIAQGNRLLDAASFANYVAALSVTRMGAQSSMPTLQEVQTFMSS